MSGSAGGPVDGTGVWSSDFAGLAPAVAYAVWRLRQEVFVVEQDCPYPDLDGRDTEPGTRHVVLPDPERPDEVPVLGYARVLDDGDTWRIGRVVLHPSGRGRGLSGTLMGACVALCDGDGDGDGDGGESGVRRDVVLDAQAPLAGWYAGFGFAVDGPEFLEDGIPHVPMRRRG
ncbi:GNAT family N-acetyltransferase [Nocardioides sp. Leaf307]|uniref:GNAT family N-acetyltransferase n=1 Tax=Nocardioides sp. Leaf307 TaxID=1736331 RepID=UPI001F160203|nr:GNAT family N-acetyltransferase [Nocardioides sp. Leaf307]